jgi:hypothetical protein
MAGKPKFNPTEAHRRQVETLAGLGIIKEDIALLIINPNTNEHIAKATLEKYFQVELKAGHVKANSAIAQSLYKQATEGNVTAGIWWTKARMGWKETSVNEHSGPNGGPVSVIQRIERCIVDPQTSDS